MSTCPVLDSLFNWASTAPKPSADVTVKVTTPHAIKGGNPSTVYKFSGILEYSIGGVYSPDGKYLHFLPTYFISALFGVPPVQEQMTLQISAPQLVPFSPNYPVLLAPNDPAFIAPVPAGPFIPSSAGAASNPPWGPIYGFMPPFSVEIDLSNVNPG
jgi:hypothetical protein